jgi:hypothetical protein
MSDGLYGLLAHIVIGLIAAVPPTLAAIAALRKARETHLIVNHRMDELLATVRREARAAGLKEGEDRKA